MTPRDALRWELLRRAEMRPYRRQESAPAVWLVAVGLALLAVVVWRLVDGFINW